MRNPMCLMVALLVACSVWAAGPPMMPGWADRLVEQLGDDDFDTREAAAKALDKAGGDAVPALRRGMQHKDAEIRARSLKIAKAIEKRTAAFFEALGADVQWHGEQVDVLSCEDRDASKLRDEHLHELAGLPWLVNLRLHKALVGDAGMLYVGRLKQLERLALDKTNVTDAGLAHLAGLVNLETLALDDTDYISGCGLAHLGKLRKLISLGLIRSAITDHGINLGISGIKNMVSLNSIGLSQTRISDAGLVRFKELTQTLGLSLNRTKIGDKGISHLKAMANLKGINLERTAITDEGCGHLAEIKTLYNLRLGHTAITLKGLKKLKQLPDLGRIDISGIRLTPDEIKDLCTTLSDRITIFGDTIQRLGKKP